MAFIPPKPGGWNAQEKLTSLQMNSLQVAIAAADAEQIAAMSAASLGDAIDLQFFSASGTWTKPANAIMSYFCLVGTGARGDSVSNSGAGGGGGGAGYLFERWFRASQLAATMAVTISSSAGASTTVVGISPALQIRAIGAPIVPVGGTAVGGNGSSGGGAPGLDGDAGGAGGAMGSDGAASSVFQGGVGSATHLGGGAGSSAVGGAGSLAGTGSGGGGAQGPLGTSLGGGTAGTGTNNTLGGFGAGGLGGTGYGAGGGGGSRGAGTSGGGAPIGGCALIITLRHP